MCPEHHSTLDVRVHQLELPLVFSPEPGPPIARRSAVNASALRLATVVVAAVTILNRWLDEPL